MNRTKASESMKQLRQERRANDQCAQCELHSTTYLCVFCKASRDFRKELRIHYRMNNNLCLNCGRAPQFEESLCEKCFIKKKEKYPNRPIRKLKKWKITNHILYNLMMEKSCSTSDLAKHVGVSERSVLKWIFENAIPNENNAKVAADFFGMKPGQLFPTHSTFDSEETT